MTAQATRPVLTAVEDPEGLMREADVTVAFVDIEGSTAINQRVGDRRWLEILREYEEILEGALGNRGVLAKSMGDGHMLVFGCPVNALRCALALQQSLDERNAVEPGEPLRVRIGLHSGQAIECASDWHGLNITLGARIADQASGGEILASAALRELAEESNVARFGNGRQVELKGLTGSHVVHPVHV